MKCYLRIGLFGGSFDPVHIGHIALAKAARKEFNLDKVFFIPAKYPPHKLNKRLSPAKTRLKMLSEAIKPYKYFELSSYELNRKETTYTYETVNRFTKLYPCSKLFFIIGSDSLIELKTWKKVDCLLKQVQFIAGRRRGAGVLPVTGFYKSIKLLKARLPFISSSRIRSLAALGKQLKGLVPAPVEKIIVKNQTYNERTVR